MHLSFSFLFSMVAGRIHITKVCHIKTSLIKPGFHMIASDARIAQICGLRAAPTFSFELKFPVELNSFSDFNSNQREISTSKETAAKNFSLAILAILHFVFFLRSL